MSKFVVLLAIFCAACGVADQPASNRTVAAFEVPLPTDADKADFLALLQQEAKAHNYHVDAATSSELKHSSEVSPITFKAAVWFGNDEESVASAMDFDGHLGRIWLTFSESKKPQVAQKFRTAIMSKIQERWPATVRLPIMPSGAIPLHEDLVRTPAGYIVTPSAASKYDH